MKGLRSIPYLILANIDLTSSAIIYLASMLSIQQRRRKLRSYLPDTMPIVTAPEALGLCESIIWLPNENLNVEKRDFFICAAKMAIKPSRRGSDINASRMLRSPDRNALSVLHEAMAWYQAKRDYEYFRHRKDICIQALNSDGIKCSLLWRAAFTTLKAGKILLVEWRCLVRGFSPAFFTPNWRHGAKNLR